MIKGETKKIFIDSVYDVSSQCGVYGVLVVDESGEAIYLNTRKYTHSSKLRLGLLALINAIAWIDTFGNFDSSIPIYTNQTYLVKMRNWIPHWIDAGWKTRTGDAVKNMDLIYGIFTRGMNGNVIWVKSKTVPEQFVLRQFVDETMNDKDAPAYEDIAGITLITSDDLVLSGFCKQEDLEWVIYNTRRVE